MSGDFDPRMLWTRRQAVAGLGAGIAIAGLTAGGAGACEAEWAGRGGRRPMLVSGAEIPGGQAWRLAHLAGATLAAIPAQTDPLRFWQAQVAPRLTRGAAVMGVTSWADYLLLRGLGEERRLRVRFQTGAGGRLPRNDPALEALAARLGAALAAEAGPEPIGWILA